MGAQQSAFTLSVHLLLAAVHFICLSGHWDGTNSRTGTCAIEVWSVKISVSFGFHPPRICYEMPFAWKLQNKEKNNRYATCLAAAIHSQAFVTF